MSETKQCQNCKKGFDIEPRDVEFYQMIKMSHPTWCPDCRAMRRMQFTNCTRLFRKTEKSVLVRSCFQRIPEEVSG